MEFSKSDEALIPDEPISSVLGHTLDRVYAVLRGEFDADLLEADETILFMDLFSDYLAAPNPEGAALAMKMYAEGGYVGEDERGRLIRTLPNGGADAINSKHEH